MPEPAGCCSVAENIIQNGMTVLYKTGVVRGDAQFAQPYQDLHCAFAVVHIPGAVAAVRVLPLAHAVQRLVHGFRHRRLIHVFRQRLQRHAGNVRIGDLVPRRSGIRTAGKAPSAVRKLARKDAVYIHLTGGLGLGLGVDRHRIIAGIQRDERPDRSV